MYKILAKIKNLLSGMEIQAGFLAVICTITMFAGLIVAGRINDMASTYRIFKSNTLGEAYYFSDFTAAAGPVDDADNLFSKWRETLQASPAFGEMYTFRYIGPAFFDEAKDIGINVILYDPGFTDRFPLLKTLGADFTEDPDGAVLGSAVSFDVTDSGELVLYNYAYQRHVAFHVIGKLRKPFKIILPTGSGTTLRLSDLINTGDIMLMQATDKVLSEFDHIHYNKIGFIFTIRSGASDSDRNKLLQDMQYLGNVESLENMLSSARDELKTTIINQLPLPVFVLLSTLIAYLSMVVLMIRKKQSEMAVAYICGASRKKLVAEMIFTCCLVTLLPCVINLLILLYIPDMVYYGTAALLTPDLVWVVAAYFAVTVIVAVVSVAAFFAGHSPMENLRGLE